MTAGSPTPAAEPLDVRVRRSCARVAEAGQLVRIDLDRIGPYAKTAERLVDSLRPARGRFGEPPTEAELALVFALDAVNFGSGYHDIVRKRPCCSGATSMARNLEDHVTVHGPLTSTRLQALTSGDCTVIFDQDADNPEAAELMRSFAAALNDLGRFLDRHGGPSGVLAAAEGSSVVLAELLTEMPSYRDVAYLDGAPVSFYKRAQITAADLHRAGVVFDDLHRLTAFADNLVPHVLRVDGVLRYDDDLLTTINRRHRLEAGSRAEIEIRAAGVQAVEMLAAGLDCRPMDLDAALWHRGGERRYKRLPRHRTRTLFY